VHISVSHEGEVGGDAFGSHALFHIPLTQLRETNERWLPAYVAG
jgi:hypothetical protein